MALKRYQERVLLETNEFLTALVKEWKEGNLKHAGNDAWENITSGRLYNERRTGHNRDLAHFCLKVPTGGGKTLLATQVIAQVHKTLLPERNGAGLMLWVVPSDQIYRDTLKALRDRSHFYRQSLEIALSRRIEIWEKHEVNRLTPLQLVENLNIVIVKLQGTKRQNQDALKFFQDAGGNIVRHFPAEDDSSAHQALLEKVSNMDMLEADDDNGRYLAKTSLANLVRLSEPLVILDEGHTAASDLAQKTLEGFNPRLIVELSATPPADANILCRVSGRELVDEEMIKLPINVANASSGTWQNCLTKARGRREELAGLARQYAGEGGGVIRPIVLVQVERTGRDQRTPEFIHAEDVREYLVQRLGVPADRVRVKSSQRDDIEGIDLMDENCPVEWIITKSALQEGWDCPNAYILVSLNNSRSLTGVTQLVGRVLRQPYVKRTPFQELNESYVYCLHSHPAEIIRKIRTALSKEGYEGDESSVREIEGDADRVPERLSIIRPQIKQQYEKGAIYLPFFGIEWDEENRERLDYFRHLLSQVDISKFRYEKVEKWDMRPDLAAAKEHFYRVELNDEALEPLNIRELARAYVEPDAAARAWLVANIGFEWYSARQLRFIVERVCEPLVKSLPELADSLSMVRFGLLTRLQAFIEEESDYQTEEYFDKLVQSEKIIFGMERKELIYTIPDKRSYRSQRALRRHDDSELQRNLFDPYPDEDNLFEKELALALDENDNVKWWLRNIPDPSGFFIQGPRRQRIFPDYIVSKGSEGQELPAILVVESKGTHLSGNLDTKYKRKVGEYFRDIGKMIPWQEVAWSTPNDGFYKHCFDFYLLDQGDYSGQEWRDKLSRILGASADDKS